ncbi:MAG: amidohydrolase family protein, partial [Candidatus Bathyarchaeota archaeon]
MTSKLTSKNVHSADMILVNGNILTVDAAFSRAQAVAIKDGRILTVGTTRNVKALAGTATKVIDLHGQTALPGFIDAHCHMWSFGIQLSQLNCRSPPITSIHEIVDKVRAQADQTPSG